MATILEGIRTLLISDDNLSRLGTAFSFDEYKEFFDEKFAPLDIPDDLRIDDAIDLPYLDPDEVDANESENEEDGGGNDDDDFPFNF